MGTFIAKLKGNNEQFYKLVDHVENEDYGNIHYDEAMVYDANNEYICKTYNESIRAEERKGKSNIC